MASLKLHYFNGRGANEMNRLILAQVGQEYEDVRYEGDKWPEFKPKTPFGVMPVLEEDGKMLGGSMIIARHLGEKYGLAGDNAWENAQIASIVDFIVDFVKEIGKLIYEKDEERKKELLAKFKSDAIPKFLGKLNELVSNDTSFLWGNKVTWADMTLFPVIGARGFLYNIVPEDQILSSYPALQKFVSTISALPNIAVWLAKRPDTQF